MRGGGYGPVMTENGSTVLREVLALPADERAQVAADLIASLDEEQEDAATVESAWAAEIERRAWQMFRDPSSGEDCEAARDRIADRLRGE
jgi:putative addiction module component (TIGR02574 family)